MFTPVASMPEEEKVVTIKLYREEAPQMTITYKDKKDLFKQFQKNLNRFDFPTDEIYWYDWENVHTRMRCADDVYIAVKDDGFAKMFARDPRNRETFPSFDSDDEEEKQELEKEHTKENRSRNRTPSPARGRGRSRSEPRHRSRHDAVHSYYPMPWNCGPWMDPRYGFMPFHYDSRAFGTAGRRGREVKHHCRCKARHEDVEKP